MVMIMKNLELKIYEKLGIKKFKEFAFKLREKIIKPFIDYKEEKEQKRILQKTPDNFIMAKGNGISDLLDFKKEILFNTGLCIASAIVSIPVITNILMNNPNILEILATAGFVTFDTYSLILQRYNNIRINNAIEKMKPLEEKRKRPLIEELKKEKVLTNDYDYIIKNKKDKEEDITIDEVLDKATYKELKIYREKLKQLTSIKSFSDNHPNIEGLYIPLPIEYNKTLILTPKKAIKK